MIYHARRPTHSEANRLREKAKRRTRRAAESKTRNIFKFIAIGLALQEQEPPTQPKL